MQKIATDPLYIRCKKVFDSCETNEQINTAINYYKLAWKRNRPDIFEGLTELTNYDITWDSLLQGVKWK